jgi:hypothetical protein
MAEAAPSWARVVRGGGGADADPIRHSREFRENFRAIADFARLGGSRTEIHARVDRLDLLPDEKRVLNAMVAVAIGSRGGAFEPLRQVSCRPRPDLL